MKKERSVNITPETTWQNVTHGAIMPDAGNAEDFNTGDWRSMRPIWHEDKCKHCMLCWVVCPDNSIIPKDGKIDHFDYEHCKGCGVCTAQCKFGALEYVPEV